MIEREFSFRTRPELIEKSKQGSWDLVVIGGGITGAAVARNAALRGIKTLLLEKSDFASATSSGSSKLIHGGLRYLEQMEFKLVYEAIREREDLRKLYSPLVQDLDFLFPTFKGLHPPRWLLRLGLTLYSGFSGFRHRHHSLSRTETMKRLPQLDRSRLSGSCLYQDGFAEDYRLVIELIKSSFSHGALPLSYAAVEEIHPKPNSIEILARDQLSNESWNIHTRYVLNCSGPFSDRLRNLVNLKPRLRLTQGVHFLVSRESLEVPSAVVLSDPDHQRIIFVIPWGPMTYIGTTDTDITAPESARASAQDLIYLTKMVSNYFQVKLNRSDIKQSWAAVRPLIASNDKSNPSAVSRDFEIEEGPSRILHVLGGKLTSHRLMAQQALNRIREFHKSQDPTDSVPLIETPPTMASLEDPRWKQYGAHLNDILEFEKTPEMRERIHPDVPLSKAELQYGIRSEMVLRPMDFLRRRSPWYYWYPDRKYATSAVNKMAETFHWSHELTSTILEQTVKEYSWDQDGY